MSALTVDRWSATPARPGRQPQSLRSPVARARRLRSVPAPRPAGDLLPSPSAPSAPSASSAPSAVHAATVPSADDRAVEQLAPALHRLRVCSRSGIDAVAAKVTVLRGQLRHQPGGDPVGHVTTRLKTVESIVAKARRKHVPLTADAVRAQVLDVAGVRVVCDVASDLYRLRDLLLAQGDLVLLSERDYLAHPKPSGYRALHLIVDVPVDVRGRREHVAVEIQLRTVAGDAWARAEHQLAYKGGGHVPEHLAQSLRRAADASWSLDASMEQVRADAVRLAC